MLGEDAGSLEVRIGSGIELRFHEVSRPFPDIADDPVLDFLVTARGEWVSVEASVRTLEGDGLGAFLAELAEDFRGWRAPEPGDRSNVTSRSLRVTQGAASI